MQRTSRKPSCLPESLDRQLNLYALAASAAGVAALALASPAEAKIIYTPTRQVINSAFPYFLSLGENNVAFELAVRICPTTSSSCVRGDTSAALRIYGKYLGNTWANSIAVRPNCGTWDGAECALALKKGTKIPTTFANYRDVMVQRVVGGTRYEGSWLPGTKNRYLGLTFHLNEKIHYGWARVSVIPAHSAPQMVAVLTGYAYETIPNKPIIAGKTTGADVVTVQPGTVPATLGTLALGRR